jgi:hypothetical protein
MAVCGVRKGKEMNTQIVLEWDWANSPTSRKRSEKWGTLSLHLFTENVKLYLNDLTAAASSSFTSKTVYSLVI